MKRKYKVTKLALQIGLISIFVAFLSGDLSFIMFQFGWVGFVAMSIFVIETISGV